MKIGVVTFGNTEDNYGQVLQCYALQKFLRNKGHEVFLIRYSAVSSKSILRKVLLIPYRIIKLLAVFLFDYKEFALRCQFKRQRRIKEIENRKHPRQFSSFKNKYICATPILNQHQLFTNPPQADIYIAGSDQIWFSDPVYYLQFAPKSAKRIAYAPSFGGAKLFGRKAEKIRQYLSTFDVISVREQQGVELCRRLGFNDVRLVPDPTFLLSESDYNQIMPVISNEDNYLLLYLLGNEMDLDVLDVYKWAGKNKIEVKYVSSQGRQDSYDKIYPNVDEWLSLIRNAKYIVTNSFHGMVFSIVMNKSFVVIPLSGSFERMNCRIYDTLNVLGIVDRIYNGSLNVLFDAIDYCEVNKRIEKERSNISQEFDAWLK